MIALISFVAGSVFGYHLKTWRLEYLKRENNRLEKKLRQIDSQIGDEMTTASKTLNVNITKKELKS